MERVTNAASAAEAALRLRIGKRGDAAAIRQVSSKET
jgi:hypothetical protein